ncbi:MAG: restriction endonuclease subunit S [Desulfobulbaceae bacterium]|nr:restriction endonuclease subunit S [Desulfobulbaceae bacterium]
MYKSGKLPSDWKISTLGALAQGFLSGGTPSTKNAAFWKGSVPWITSKWLNSRLYLDSGEKCISEESLLKSATTVVPRNNLVFATRVGVGKVAVNRLDLAINQDLAGVLIDSEQYNIEFLAYQLRSERIQNTVASHKRGATIQGITRENLKSLEIYLPPFPEQRKIAGVLGVVQRAIEQQERLLHLTAELKKTLLHQLFTQGLRGEPQKQTEIGPVPESWEVKPLEDYLTEAQYGISAKGSETGRYAVLRMTNQQQGKISGTNLQYIDMTPEQFEKFRVKRQDILFNRTNSLELVGRTAIFDLEGDFVFASYLIRLRSDAFRLRPFFLNHYFNCEETQIRLKSIATRAVSQSNISATRLRGFVVPLPPLEEQDEIVDNIDCLDRKIAVHAQKKLFYEDIFRTLLHQLMTAQIRVFNINLPELLKPASV